MGRPDPFFVIEAGAGTGTLARDILAAEPACRTALRYLLVERSEALRAEQARHLALESTANVLGPPGLGPSVASLADLPAGPLVGVVIANELLDNVPFALLERGRDGWLEVCVDADCQSVLVPAHPALSDEADRLVADDGPVSTGARIPVQQGAQEWLRRALRVVQPGRVVVIDYAATTGELARRPWREWVRTYRRHGPGTAPFADPGAQDVTCEVAVDQLGRVASPTTDVTQAEFLRAHGLSELVDAAQSAWTEGAARGDVASLKAKSRISEAAALTDPAGLGAFRVLEWVVS